MLTAPGFRFIPSAGKPSGTSDFDVPADQATDPVLNLGDAPTQGRAAEPTDPVVNLSEPPLAFPLPPLAPPPAPAPAGPKKVVVPPPPRFAAPFLRRVLRALGLAGPAADVVQLTVIGPPQAVPGEIVKLQVFAHQPQAFESVCTLSRAFHQDGELLAAGYVRQEVPRGAEIALHLSVARAGVGRPLLQLNWLGQPQPRTFDVHVPWESPTGLTAGVLSAGLNGVLAGRVEFRIQLGPRRR
jgi:hypothetical protein